jgi:hypothetical protein
MKFGEMLMEGLCGHEWSFRQCGKWVMKEGVKV